MAFFKACVRKGREDGFYPVYIRVTQNRSIGYIKTDKVVNSRSVKNGKLVNDEVIGDCGALIKEYNQKLLNVDISKWNAKDVIEFLSNKNELPSFSTFAKLFINEMIAEDRKAPSDNYKNAYTSYLRYVNKKELQFIDVNSKYINGWIDSMKNSKYKKRGYPKLLKAIFDAGCVKYNDYDRGIIPIYHRPFNKVEIPKLRSPQKRTAERWTIRRYLLDKQAVGKEKLARDVMWLVFCLAGINTADLYRLKKSKLKRWSLCYQRKKTELDRADYAYMEIFVPKVIRHLFEEYKGEGDMLFDFSKRYSTPQSFNVYLGRFMKAPCERLQIPKLSSYYFRHTWATLAQNKCGASMEDVAFCLNHASAHKVTGAYVEKDFSRIKEINEKVINYVFNLRIKKKKLCQIKAKRKEKEPSDPPGQDGQGQLNDQI